MLWDADAIDKLKELWAEGLSCSQIAARLPGDATRNAVIGKVNRLQLPTRINRARTTRSVYVPSGRNRTRPTPRKQAKDKATAPEIPVHPLPPTETWPPTKASSPVALDDLKPHHCRWPVNTLNTPYLACGCEKLSGTSYCVTHHAIAVQPPNKKPSNWIPGRAALGIGAAKAAEEFLKETA